MTRYQRNSIGAAVAVFALGAAWFAAEPRARAPQRPEALASASGPPAMAAQPPLRSRDYTFEPRNRAGVAPAPTSRFGDTPAGVALGQYWETIQDIGDIAEMRRKTADSLARLQPHTREAATLLYDAFHLAAEDPQEQWTLVKVLGDLISQYAFDPLDDIARLPMPPNEGRDPRVHPELIAHAEVRMRALDGLSKLAAGGSYSARQSLYEIAVDPAYDEHRAIKMTAILGYVGRGDEAAARAEHLKGRVPSPLAWTLADDMLNARPGGEDDEPEFVDPQSLGG